MSRPSQLSPLTGCLPQSSVEVTVTVSQTGQLVFSGCVRASLEFTWTFSNPCVTQQGKQHTECPFLPFSDMSSSGGSRWPREWGAKKHPPSSSTSWEQSNVLHNDFEYNKTFDLFPECVALPPVTFRAKIGRATLTKSYQDSVFIEGLKPHGKMPVCTLPKKLWSKMFLWLEDHLCH